MQPGAIGAEHNAVWVRQASLTHVNALKLLRRVPGCALHCNAAMLSYMIWYSPLFVTLAEHTTSDDWYQSDRLRWCKYYMKANMFLQELLLKERNWQAHSRIPLCVVGTIRYQHHGKITSLQPWSLQYKGFNRTPCSMSYSRHDNGLPDTNMDQHGARIFGTLYVCWATTKHHREKYGKWLRWRLAANFVQLFLHCQFLQVSMGYIDGRRL